MDHFNRAREGMKPCIIQKTLQLNGVSFGDYVTLGPPTHVCTWKEQRVDAG
jgi:hypothetical protein